MDACSHKALAKAGEVHAERHRDDSRSVCPRPKQSLHYGFAVAAARAQHFANQRFSDAARDPDPTAVYVLSEYRPGTVSAVTVLILVGFVGEVAGYRVHAIKGGMIGLDAGIQHRDFDTLTGILVQRVGADIANPPGIAARIGGANVERADMGKGHDEAHAKRIRL